MFSQTCRDLYLNVKSDILVSKGRPSEAPVNPKGCIYLRKGYSITMKTDCILQVDEVKYWKRRYWKVRLILHRPD